MASLWTIARASMLRRILPTRPASSRTITTAPSTSAYSPQNVPRRPWPATWSRSSGRSQLWSRTQTPPRNSYSKRWQSTNSNPHPNTGSKRPFDPSGPEPRTLSERMKRLSREYGWSALGVYLLLSALDFPFCFLAVRWLGVERIGRYEQAVLGQFWHLVEIPFPNLRRRREDEVEIDETDGVRAESKAVENRGMLGAVEREGRLGSAVVGAGQEQGPVTALAKHDNASIWTQLALAYAVHKSLIFFRVPLTAAVTPRVVKTLRGWGWDIAKKRTPMP